MKLSTPGQVPVYTVSGASTARKLPEWISRQRRMALKKNPDVANDDVELLQNFSFEEASNCVQVSEDGNWVMSTGTYKPQIHLHSTQELSLSFSRHTKSENLTFIFLDSPSSNDYAKSLHLQVDRTLEFHNLNGMVHETRIPRFGRDLSYVRHTAEALIPAVGTGSSGQGEVFRLNLERGQFMAPFEVDVGATEAGNGLQCAVDVGSVNVSAVAEYTHGLCGFGTSVGTIEFFDPRSKGRVATLGGLEGAVTALSFAQNGLSFAYGNSSGKIGVHDLRSPIPIYSNDQGYGFAVKNLVHMSTITGERKWLAADQRIIKIYDENDGRLWTSVEPEVNLNHVAWCKNSGMLFTANEGKQMHSFLIPNLGPAPKWCSFLDTVVEEMAAEVQSETYQNYKFMTVPELKTLSLDHLIGKSNLLRPYMHGYFVASKLYDQARLIANPYVWEEERAKRVKEKIEKERASRIRVKKVKVNQKLADKILKKQEKRAKVDTEAGVLSDSRFSKLFEDEEFMVDENSWEFRILNPSTRMTAHSDAAAQSDDRSRNESRDASSDGEDIRMTSRTPDGGIEMRVSSSQVKLVRSKDKAFGSRPQRASRVSEGAAGSSVGEKHVTFVPESRKKRPPPVVPQKRDNATRRSASGNTFRRL